MRHRVSSSQPTSSAHQDQALAAARDAASAVIQVAVEQHVPLFEGFEIRWLRDQVAALLRALGTRQAVLCPHLQGDPSPRVMHGAAWRPGQLHCTPCAARSLPPDPEDDDLCDRCGRHDPGLLSTITAVGTLMFAFGLCPACSKSVGITRPPAARKSRNWRRSARTVRQRHRR